MIPYVYLIGWKELDVWYCGVRYHRNCQPSDLWSKYFTSSRHVKKFRELHGEPDHIEILKEFADKESALIFEEQKLREFDVLNKPNWLNKNICGKFAGNYKPHSPETKLKMSISHKNMSDETREKLLNAARNRTQAYRIKMSEAKKGKKRKPFSEEWRRKLGDISRGKKLGPRSEETKRKISESHKARKQKQYIKL